MFVLEDVLSSERKEIKERKEIGLVAYMLLKEDRRNYASVAKIRSIRIWPVTVH